MLLSIKDASLAYGHRPLLDRAELVVDAGEKIALIGRNGTGKSSLLQVVAGIGALDRGELWTAQDARVALVPQEPAFAEDLAVFDAVAEGVGAKSRTLSAYHAATEALSHASAPADIARLTDEVSRLQAEIERDGAWVLEHRVETALGQLGLDGSARVGELSGGWKKRVALARALVADPALLLLDEPTNHLDVDGIRWLEALLRDLAGAVICITHDRRFIDAFATRIVELDRGTLRTYPVPFEKYREQKLQQLEYESTLMAKADKVLAGEEVWIRKGVEARRTRNAGRVLRLTRLRALRAERRARMGKVNLRVDRGEASGRLVAELDEATVRFGNRTIIDRFTTRLIRGDKVGLIGPNGCGKTTLLRLILGAIEPDSGTIRRGTNLQAAYYDQLREALDPEATLADTISPGSDTIEIGRTKRHIIAYIEDFLFDPVRARSPVKTLSGGERNRLLLARLFARPANVLVLDEPTNDLDIDTLELLEELLQDYAGTLFLVSHDRAFLDNVVTQVIAFDSDGVLREYPGGYSDWERAQARMRELGAGADAARDGAGRQPQPAKRSGVPVPREAAVARKTAARGAPRAGGEASGATAKLSFRENQELEQLPARIEALEARIADLQQQLADPALYQREPEDARAAALALTQAEDELAAAFARWEALEERR